MALQQSGNSELGMEIINFNLKGIDDKYYELKDCADKKIIIIVFMCNHCPYVKGIIGRLVKLQSEYTSKSVQFIGINPNDVDVYPEDSFENMKLFAKERNINFPYLIDEDQKTAKSYDALCTPDIYLFDEKRKLRYRARVDDNWQDESKVTTQDLKKAIDCVLENREIDFKQIPSIGCSIKWKN